MEIRENIEGTCKPKPKGSHVPNVGILRSKTAIPAPKTAQNPAALSYRTQKDRISSLRTMARQLHRLGPNEQRIVPH